MFKQQLIEFSQTIGIDKIKFTTADPFEQLRERLIIQQNLGYASGFEHKIVEERVEPRKIIPNAQSIIAIALAYPTKLKNPPRNSGTRGIFCRASWGIDYHFVLKEKLRQLEQFIKKHHPDSETTCMVDTGQLSDRAVAERAGIGWSGKNTSIITPEFGSYVYLGEMITSLSFEPDEPIEDQCGTCTKCIDACPTQAIVSPYQLNSQRCIAFLTQTKEMLTPEFREKIGNRLYGCDTCQVVCPKNKGMDFHHQTQFEPENDLARPLLQPILKLSNRQFKEKFGRIAGSWRGKMPIQRNAIIALAHFKEENSLSNLAEILFHDQNPVIRATTAWAIGKIGGESAQNLLRQALENETEKIVLDEIHAYIK